jgi:hypothetical protein
MKPPLSICVLVLAFATTVAAQSPSGSVSGYVRDATGGVLEGVVLDAREQESGRAYTTATDARGLYQFLRLLPGEYRVSARYQGFQPAQGMIVAVEAGQATSLDLVLEVSGGEQTVTVTGETAPLDLSSSYSGHIVSEVSFASLPVNGRSLDQLAMLAPGAIPVRAKDTRSVSGFTSTISDSGARGTAFLLDGTDIQHGVFRGATPGGVSGLLLGMDSVKEFEVVADAYPAYLGGTGGALVNIVTRSGSAVPHGSLFEYYRDNQFDAKNFFDRETPPFSRHQFGGSLGGPLPGGRQTFFVSYEGLRERLGLTLFNTVPTEAARQGILPGRVVTVSPAIRPILDRFPLPNSTDFGDGTASYRYTQVQPTDDHHVTARTDFNLSASDTLFVRYTFQDSAKIGPLRVSQEGFDNDLAARIQFLTAEETHVFSPRLLSTVQLGYNDSRYRSSTLTRADLAGLPPLIDGRPNLGRFSVSGLSGFGTDTADITFPTRQLELGTSLHYAAGTHDVRLGVNWKHYRSNGFFNYFFDGLLSYNNLESFLVNAPDRFSGATEDSDADRAFRQNLFALYIHDQHRWRRDLTLSYGLRYEFFTVPTERDGRIANLRQLMDEPTTGDPLFKNPSSLNFAPRVGVAWNVGGNNRTLIRTGFGVFHDPLRENFYGYNQTIQPPYVTVLTVTRPPYPGPLNGPNKGKPLVNPIEFELSTPYMLRYHLTLQRMLGRNLALNVGYVGSRGTHLPRAGDINTAQPVSIDDEGRPFFGTTAGARINPSYDRVRFVSTDANSVYNALQVGVVRRWDGGLQFGANYTYGRSIDDASALRRDFTNSVADVPPWYFDRLAERGLSNFHVGHYAALHATWDLPFRFTQGAAAVLLNEWQLAAIGSLSSGYPFTLNLSFDRANNTVREGHRPDLVPGASNNPVLGEPDRYFDVSAFQVPQLGYLGTLGRNTLIGPGYASIDLSLSRTIALGRAHRLQLRIEGFNILNRANFAAPQNSATGGVVIFNNASGQPVGNAARIFSTAGSARQVQLGVRWTF